MAKKKDEVKDSTESPTVTASMDTLSFTSRSFSEVSMVYYSDGLSVIKDEDIEVNPSKDGKFAVCTLRQYSMILDLSKYEAPKTIDEFEKIYCEITGENTNIFIIMTNVDNPF